MCRILQQAERMLAIEECLRKRTALKPLEEALVIGVDARAHHRLLVVACLLYFTTVAVGKRERAAY